MRSYAEAMLVLSGQRRASRCGGPRRTPRQVLARDRCASRRACVGTRVAVHTSGSSTQPRGPVGKPKPPPSHARRHRTASCSARSCGRRSASGVPGSSRRPHRQVRIGYHAVAEAIASSPRPPRAVYASRKRASSTTADLAGAACSECYGRVGIRHAMTNDASVAIGRWDRQRQLAVGSGLSLHQ